MLALFGPQGAMAAQQFNLLGPTNVAANTGNALQIQNVTTNKPPSGMLPSGRAQDVQVCPDPENERLAVCAGARSVSVYSKSADLEATLTGFTGSVTKCAWHFHLDTATGNKIYLIATCCDDGQLVIHQQNYRCIDKTSVPRRYVAGMWVVTFGHLQRDLRLFTTPVTTLEWMPTTQLEEEKPSNSGDAEQPFTLATGSDRLIVVYGWRSAEDGGVSWQTKHYDIASGDEELSVITALSWAPQRRLGDAQYLSIATGTYADEDDFPATGSYLHIMKFDQTDIAEVVILQVAKKEGLGWVRDLAWTNLPYATKSKIIVAYRHCLMSLIRCDDGCWELRKIQVFQTGSSSAPTPYHFEQHFKNIWHLSWSRQNTLLAITADQNSTVVIRKVVCGNSVPSLESSLAVSSVVQVSTESSVLIGRVKHVDGSSATVSKDHLALNPLTRGHSRSQTQSVTTPTNKVSPIAVQLTNMYDTPVWGVSNGVRNGTNLGPWRLETETVAQRNNTGPEYQSDVVMSSGLEMWEIVNEASFQSARNQEQTF